MIIKEFHLSQEEEVEDKYRTPEILLRTQQRDKQRAAKREQIRSDCLFWSNVSFWLTLDGALKTRSYQVMWHNVRASA